MEMVFHLKRFMIEYNRYSIPRLSGHDTKEYYVFLGDLYDDNNHVVQ